MLAKEGSNWYDCRTTADLILDQASSIRLKIKKTGEKLTVFENISLDAFQKRPNKTTRVRLILTFTSEHTAMVRVQDLGFGEFFPSSGIVSRKKLKQIKEASGMEQYIQCGDIAENPLYVKELGIHIYTAEEFCYYIFNNT